MKTDTIIKEPAEKKTEGFCFCCLQKKRVREKGSVDNEDTNAGQLHENMVGLETRDAPGCKKNIDTRYLLIILALASVLYGAFLGSMMLWDADEALYTEIAREMAVTKDYITTQWNFTPWFCHPPLYFWLVTVFSTLAGWTEWAARIPSALFGILTVITVYFFGKLLFNQKTGFYAALAFTITMQIWLQARMALLDMVFLFFITAGLYCFIRGFIEEKHSWFTLGWTAAGLSVIAKGPVGAILILVYTCCYLVSAGKLRRDLPSIFTLRGVLIFIGIAAPWYVMMSVNYGDAFTQRVFGYFFLNRLIQPVMDQGGPWYFYLPVLLGGFLPWTVFLPLVFYSLIKELRNTHARFLFLWITLTFVVFSLSATKLPNYILFLYPGLSMALGWLIYRGVDEEHYRKHVGATFLTLSLSVLLLIMVFRILGQLFFPAQIEQYHSMLVPLDIILVIGACAVLYLTLRRRHAAFYGTIITTAILYLAILLYIPFVEQLRPEHGVVTDLNRFKVAGDRLVMTEDFGHRYSFLFYTGLPLDFFDKNEDLVNSINAAEKKFVVMKKNDFYHYRKNIKTNISIIRNDGHVVLFYVGSSLAREDNRKPDTGKRAF